MDISQLWEDCDFRDTGIATLSCIPPLIKWLVLWGLVFAGIVALFMLIFAGYQFINSGGDPKSVEGARKTATYAIIGLILVFLSFFIVQLIGLITGLESSCIEGFGFDVCT